MRTLTSPRELDAAVALLAKLVSQPTFPEAPLQRERERVIQGLREAAVKPDAIAQRTFSELIYPRHPYGRDPLPETIAAITRDDLVDFHRRYFGANRAVVSIVGAIDRARAEAIAEQLTRDLPQGVTPAPMPPVEAPAAVERRIPHPATQSHIVIGAPAMARSDPDFFPLFVGNYVLGGGGFVSRLTAESVELAQADAFAWVSQTTERFDLVLLDPPFGEGALDRIVPRLAGVLAPGAALYVESDAPVDIDTAPWTGLPGVRVHRADRAGLVHYHLLLMPAEPTGA